MGGKGEEALERWSSILQREWEEEQSWVCWAWGVGGALVGNGEEEEEEGG